jgi:hypothetical protein
MMYIRICYLVCLGALCLSFLGCKKNGPKSAKGAAEEKPETSTRITGRNAPLNPRETLVNFFEAIRNDNWINQRDQRMAHLPGMDGLYFAENGIFSFGPPIIVLEQFIHDHFSI